MTEQSKNHEPIITDSDFHLCSHVKGDSFPTCKRTVKCLVIILCLKGMIRYEHNNKTMYAKVGDLIILNSEQTIANMQQFYDFEGTVLMASEKIVPLLPYQQTSYLTLKRNLEDKPIISLKQEDIETIKLNLQLLNCFINKHNNEETVFKVAQMLFNEFILSQKETSRIDSTTDKPDLLVIAERFAELVAEKSCKNINVTRCCEQLKYTSGKLAKAVKEYYKISPHKYITLKKLDKSFEFLQNTSYSIQEISERLTFSSESAFCRTFKKYTDITPLQFFHLAPRQQQDIIRRTIPYQIFP